MEQRSLTVLSAKVMMFNRTVAVWIGGISCLCLGLTGEAVAQQTADLLIRGGLVFDGTGSRAFQADIAVKDGRILAVGDLKDYQADTTLSARGHHVTPGFIDLHSHADWGLSDPQLSPSLNNLTQGITTVVVGQDGRHAWPVGSSLSQQAELWRSQGVGTNVIPLVGHGSTRLEIMGWQSRQAEKKEVEAMARRIRVYLDQGAWGLSTGLDYLPGRFATLEELVGVTRPVRDIDGVYISHLRNQGIKLIQSIEEMLQVGKQTGVRVVATHIKSVGRRNWGNALAAVTALAEGHRQGIAAYADLYPYRAAGSGVDVPLVSWSALVDEEDGQLWLPPVWMSASELLEWVFRLKPKLSQHYTLSFLKQQSEADIRTLANGQLLELLRSEELFRQKLREAWADPQRRPLLQQSIRQRLDGPGGAEIFVVTRHPDSRLVGLNLVQAAQTLGLDEVEAVVRLTLGGASFAELHISEDDIITFLRQPYIAGSTDGTIPEYGHGRTHPRSYGAFIRRLARYVMHLRAVQMPFAIRTATGLPAEIIGIKDRGYLQPGQWADILVFDPRMLRDHATYNNPHQYSRGIIWVLVNGEVVIREGQPNGRLAGQVILKNQ